jgi:hypothetical protein
MGSAREVEEEAKEEEEVVRHGYGNAVAQLSPTKRKYSNVLFSLVIEL